MTWRDSWDRMMLDEAIRRYNKSQKETEMRDFEKKKVIQHTTHSAKAPFGDDRWIRFKIGSSQHVYSVTNFRILIDWLQECCDEMEGGDEDVKNMRQIFEAVDGGTRTKLLPSMSMRGRCCLLFSGQRDERTGNPLTADQCEELAKQLRRVARRDREREAEVLDREVSSQKAKVEELIKEFGVDRLRDIVDELEPGPFTGGDR